MRKNVETNNGGLFEAVERFEEATNMCRMLRADETRGLLTIHNLIEMSMEKGIFNVELMNRPRVRECIG
jgi:hypothetical protein